MATVKEEEHTAVNGSEKEPPAQEEAVGDLTPERRHVDAFLDISEEELEPHEYHCYSGWEEDVHGWARVAPLSCILVTPKTPKKPKQKEAGNSTPSSVDSTVRGNADSSASIAEQRCESHVGQHKKSIPSNQHMGSWSNTAVAAMQNAAADWPVLNATQITTSKIEDTGALRGTIFPPHYLPPKYSENQTTTPQKHRHRPSNTVVPIKNFTFLPPIESPHKRVSGQLCSGKKAPEGETKEENCFMFDKKSGTRGPTDSATLTSKYRTCQHRSQLLSIVSVSIPKRYQVPASSKPETVHRPSYSMGQSLTQSLHSSTAAGAQGHMHPSKTACM